MMRTFATLGVVSLLLLGGCPVQQGAATQLTVTAVLGYSRSQGDAPVSVTFSAGSSTSLNGGELRYHWDFDDGTTADEMEPRHVFQQPGRYVVTLTVTDAAAERGIATVEIRARGTGVTAGIGADVTTGTAPLWVQFDGTVSQAPDDSIHDYFWTFGDGETARQPQPRHRFNYANTYAVNLRVVTAGGLEDSTEITITATPAASDADQVIAVITSDVFGGPASLLVQFDGTESTAAGDTINSYIWTFGDGDAGTGDSISHVYADAGQYTVTLRITTASGTENTTTATIVVTAPDQGGGGGGDTASDVVADISANPTTGPAPLIVEFDATASQAPDDPITGYEWDFGNNETSTQPQPAQVYLVPGEYVVTLRVTTASGAESTAQTTITVTD